MGSLCGEVSKATTPTASSPGAMRADCSCPSRTFTGVCCLALSLAACSSPSWELVKPTRDRGRAHTAQLVHLGCMHGIGFVAVVGDGVANQQAAIFLIKVADPHLDRFGGTLLRGQQPHRLACEQ